MNLNAILLAFECVAFGAVAQSTPGTMTTNAGDTATVSGVAARGVVRRTADGGYRCVRDAGDAVMPGETVIPDGSPEAASIARACGVCQRLRETPKDSVLLGVLANECNKIQDPEAFGHYLSIYRLGCLATGKSNLAANAWQTLIAKDTKHRYVALLSDERLTQPCPRCSQTENRASRPRCKLCGGKRLVEAPWKVKRVYNELLHDGEMNFDVLTAEVDRSEPPPPAVCSNHVQNVEDPAEVPGIEAPVQFPNDVQGAITPRRVKTDKELWGKRIIVTGKVTQTGMEIGGQSVVFLEGILRCQMAAGQRVSSRIVGYVIQLQGTVVPRPDLSITAQEHMLDCVIAPVVRSRSIGVP